MNPSAPSAGMPAWGSNPNTPQALGQSMAELAPLATEYHGAQTGVGINQVANKVGGPTGNLAKFGHFLGGVASQTGHIAEGVAKWLGQQTVSMATAPVRFGTSEAHGILDNITLGSINAQNKQQSARMDTLNSQYKSGQITKDQYQSALNSLMQDQRNTSSQENSLLHRLPADQHQATQAAIDTASTLVTVLTAGFGKAFATGITATGLEPLAAKTTADYLASVDATVFFKSAEEGVARLASDPAAFAKLTPLAQKIIQTGTAEVLTQGTRMTAGQIARATVVNIALKYPIYYQWMSSSGAQLYDELDNKKYGAAVRTVAFNAALVVSGGPIGKALSYLGAGSKALVARTFGRTTFLDELSRAIGNGDPAGLFKAVNSITDPKIKAEVVRGLSAVEATNVAAEGEPKAAAWRVIKGMAAYEGVSLDTFTHEEALHNMVNFSNAQRLADFWGKKLKLGPITVGRLDARALDTISAGLTKADESAAGMPSEIASALPKETAVDMSKAPDFLQPTGEGAAKAGASAKPALPETLQKVQDMLPKGYTVESDGAVLDSTGKELTTGQIQDLTQAPYLTEFEKASREGDTATMQRIAKEHPDDNRVSMGSIAATTTGPTALPSLSADTKAALMDKARQTAATQATDPIAQRLQAWEDLKAQNPSQAWANNENFDKQIKALIQKHDDPAMLDRAIRGIKASFTVEGIPEGVSRQLAKMGYIPIKPVKLEAPFVEGGGKLATRFAQAGDNFFIKAVQPLPVLGAVGDTLTRFGLSPNAATQQVYQTFNENISKNLKEAGVLPNVMGEDAKQSTDTLLKQLSDYAHNPTVGKITNKMPITDFRMMTIKDIQAATGMTAREALAVQQSIARAYIQVPLAIRGLGDRAVDALYAGPQGALARRYFRLQGALRFSWNPFFEYMRVIPKTEILTESAGGGLIQSIFTGRAGQIPEVRTMLRDAGMFDEAGKLGNVMGAEAADLETVGRNISKHLLPMQERSISGLVISQADRMGVSVEEYIHSYPQQVRDTIQAIAQYDRHANFLNSPLARTLNVAIFPFRFETKVAGFLARGLARQPLMTQVAFINGLMQAHAWLNSPEGQAWYARNSTAIGLFDYITPLAEMNHVFQALLPGHDHSLGNFGALGGLPFGWIPQLTDAEGWTHFNQPGVDATTGQVIPNYVPVSARGQLAVAIQDLIGSLFSYPGAEAGLPSKTGMVRNLALGLTGATKTSDLKLVTRPATQQQLTYAQAVQAANPQAAAQAQGQSVIQKPGLVPSQTVPGLHVPSQDSSLLHPTPKAGTSAAKPKKLKKGQYTPALLPGQTQYGQLQGA